jgi:hypothetical protein
VGGREYIGVTATEVPAALGDTITVIRARGRRLSKLIDATGSVENYDAARTFDISEVPVVDLPALERLLWQLLRRSDCAIVRGGIANPIRIRGVRRLLYPDPDTGDAPTLRDVPRRWLALDFDRLSRPDQIAPQDLVACARVATETLPDAFREVQSIVQATARHGIAPGIRLRLWYWLDRLTTGAELKRWLRGAPIDTSVFGAAQVIYTAAPLFLPGACDPLLRRLAVMPGVLAEVTVPSTAALAPPPLHTDARISGGVSNDRALAGVVRAIANARFGERNRILYWAACRLAEHVRARLLDDTTALAILCEAARYAGLPPAEASHTALSGLRRGEIR